MQQCTAGAERAGALSGEGLVLALPVAGLAQLVAEVGLDGTYAVHMHN
jgi:hypothetical protein